MQMGNLGTEIAGIHYEFIASNIKLIRKLPKAWTVHMRGHESCNTLLFRIFNYKNRTAFDYKTKLHNHSSYSPQDIL